MFPGICGKRKWLYLVINISLINVVRFKRREIWKFFVCPIKIKQLVYLLLVNKLHIYFVTLNFFVSKRDKQTYLTTLLSFTQVIYVKVYINVDTTCLCFQLSHIVFVLHVSAYTYLLPGVFGEAWVEKLHVVMIELVT